MTYDVLEGVMGNREVPRIEILEVRGDASGARFEAIPEEEGGSWGKHGFPHATEPKAKEHVV
jgi:hypothetical protein